MDWRIEDVYKQVLEQMAGEIDKELLRVMMLSPADKEKYDERCKEDREKRKYKLALIDNNELAFVHNETYKAFRLDKDMNITENEIEKYKFIRWATGFDV